MAKLPQKITVDLQVNKVYVDGEEFPYYITEQGVDILGLGARNDLALVMIPVMALNIEVIPKEEKK